VEGTVRIVALGGLGEVGMNCLVMEAHRRLVVVDCGLTFPDREPGVDVIHADFSWLFDRARDVDAVVLTHGHEDHIGALPYLLERVHVPIYGPSYALGLVDHRLREHDLDRPPQLFETRPGKAFTLGSFEIRPFSVLHSIPDATGLVLRSPAGTLVHTGDFKLASAPETPLGPEDAIERAGGNVRLLMSDSTNVEVEGSAGEEGPVEKALDARIGGAKQRVVVGLFSSNVDRVASLLRIAKRHRRKVLMLGRSLQTHVQVSDRLKLLPTHRPPFVHADDAQRIPRNELLVLATGSQGEPFAALPRLAAGEHPSLRLDPGDEVVFSSRVIPGRELGVRAIVDAFERRGVRTWTSRDDPTMHVSGHACRDEQRRMIERVKPRAFVPVHGTYTHLQRHAELARSLGVEDTLVVENGTLVELDASTMRIAGRIPTGRVHRQWQLALGDEALRERRDLARRGLVVVALTLGKNGDLVAAPELSTRGLDTPDPGTLAEARRRVRRAVGSVDRGADTAKLLEAASLAARRAFEDALGWRPWTEAVATRLEK